MAHPLTLPTFGALALVGSALGVYLGQDAIAQINPLYYSDPDTSFHADLVPNQSSRSEQPKLQTASLDVVDNCVGCRLYPEEYRPIHDPAVDGYEDGQAASARVAVSYGSEKASSATLPRAEEDPGVADVVRYSRYRVSEDEEEETDYASAEDYVEDQTLN